MKNTQIVKDLTPEQTTIIWKSIEQRNYENKVSKEMVLHNLKQIKAEFGKVRKRIGFQNDNTQNAIDICTAIIDKKIAKLTIKK
jgi:hypothetical protein